MKSNRNTFLTAFILVLFLALTAQSVKAQQEIMNVDSLFQQARQLAFHKKLAKAQELCTEILDQKPDYFDARVLLANTFAWQHNYDRAHLELQKIFESKPKHYDALLASSDYYFWEGSLDKALETAKQGLSDYPNDENFLFKISRILLKMGKSAEAQRRLLQLLNINPGHAGAKALLAQIKKIRIFNRITLGHSFEYFAKPYQYRWHMFNLDYQRKTPIGNIIASVRMADVVYDGENLFETGKAFQFALDAYPRISKNNYAYLSYGFSNQALFPKQRAGAEFYQKLPLAFEVSAGFRFLQFQNIDETYSNTWIYTGHVGKYIKNYWLSFRPYLSPKSSGLSQSYYFIIRRYFNTADNYLGLQAGTGNSPDAPTDYLNPLTLYKLKTQSIQLDFQHLLGKQWLIKILMGYKKTEYHPETFRNVFYSTVQLACYF